MNLSAIERITKGKTRTSGISNFAEIEISKVYANPDQPRKEFNEEDISELAMAIQQDGLLQPIVVVKRDNGYMIVSGERRYRAHLWLEYKTIKTHVINVDDAKVLELALIENIQREDLTDFEVAIHIGKLWASKNYATKLHLSSALGKSSSYLSKAFSSLKLDESIIKDVQENKREIGLSVLDEISRVKDKAMQKDVYRMYLSGFITRDGIAEYRELKIDSECYDPSAVEKKVRKSVVQKSKGVEEESCRWFNSTNGEGWSLFLTGCKNQHSFSIPSQAVTYWELEYCPYCSKKIISIDEEVQEKVGDKIREVPWVIVNNIFNKDGFNYEKIIDLSNYLGLSLPAGMNYENDKDKRYKITIEEM